MADVRVDPQILAHLEWLGFVRPIGLVVSAPALVHAGAILDRRDSEGQQLLRACVAERTFDPNEEPAPYLPDFRRFAESVLGWSFSPKGYAGTAEFPIPTELEVPLPDYGETLRPDFAVRELEPKDGASPWQLLVRVLEPGEDFDRVLHGHGQLEASAHGRMERLLRQTSVPAGLLFSGRVLRLISAPYGESSGWLDYRVPDMLQTAGRPISTAMRMLLNERRLLTQTRHERLAALLEDSRKYQNEVSERLAEQVLHALYEFLRGFQAAHDASKGELLREVLAEHPDEVYRAMLTVMLRLVFLLYVEERDMLPEDDTFLRYYSLAGLYERLREDAALFPDTMDQRYGAWAQLLVLFRMIYDGAECGAMRLPERHGVLFDPDRFPFLEGRPLRQEYDVQQRIEVPLVPDGTIYRALENLLVLDGERISYRALDVEQIGSVYETMMGFRLETATGRTIAIKAQKKQGAPTAVDLEALLEEAAGKREKWLQERADRKLTDTLKKAVVAATTVEDLHAALLPVIDVAATPDLAPRGAMVLQPSQERRRSGSHYTPRVLTEPIVRTTLAPILDRLRGEDGRPPRPAQILDLKVCDPAMGSGAFLVEACRQLGEALVEAWHTHGEAQAIPGDEDEVIFARRLVAQRCLYGVDRNPVAVDLAKMSLWLVTLAKDHPLTFVDHALRQGDSLVGLSRKQIEAFHWEADAPRFQAGFETMQVREHMAKVAELRQLIRESGESVGDWELRELWDEAQAELSKVRLFGDLVIAAFFESDKRKEREARRAEFANLVVSGRGLPHRLEELRLAEQSLGSFHWEIEFPEVFQRENAGFDAIIGNPPFMRGKSISSTLGDAYRDWLVIVHEGANSSADLSAHFVRRAFDLARTFGCFGLIATNTIAQGDTRAAGLRMVRRLGGTIYNARRRYTWPGLASVTVSILHVCKGDPSLQAVLDGVPVDRITAFLLHTGIDEDPPALQAARDACFQGTVILGRGFTIEDEPSHPLVTRRAQLEPLLENATIERRLIRPFMGGEDVNSSPTLEPTRWIIDFGGISLDEAQQYPVLFDVVKQNVKPDRDHQKRDAYRERWWQFAERQVRLYRGASQLSRVLVIGQTATFHCLAFLPIGPVYAQTLNVFLRDTFQDFTVLQSRVHEVWARLLSSSIQDNPRYWPSDCFETYPYPEEYASNLRLEQAGKIYYNSRAAVMLKNNEGLTKTYHRFHDPDEENAGVMNLRELHADMDRAVLDAFGWADIPTYCEFLLDYEIDEDEWGSKKKPYRYRWPDDVRDEVLARLLELNAERAKEEARSGAAAQKKMSPKRTPTASGMKGLFS